MMDLDKHHALLLPADTETSIENIARRGETRLPTHLPSTLTSQDQSIYTTIINLSAHGIGFLSAIPLEKNTTVKIRFERKRESHVMPVELDVNVKTCHEVDLEYYIGGTISNKSVEYTRFVSAGKKCD